MSMLPFAYRSFLKRYPKENHLTLAPFLHPQNLAIMKFKHLIPSFFFIFLASTTTSLKAQAVNTSDSLALVDIYNTNNGPGWTRKQNWLNGPVSTWQGVTVTGSRVTAFSSPQNNMTGKLSASIGNLTALTELYLHYNQFTGTLPSSIGNLVNLVQLNLSVNFFSGDIPASLGNLTNVVYMYLHSNSFSGNMPASIGNLASVVILSLYSNQLSGSIPASIGNLSHLNSLWLYNNQLSGSIPASIGKLKELTGINFENNKLSGSIPDTIGSLSKLTGLNISRNQLTGNIPESIGKLKNLGFIDLSLNQLTGKLPASIRQLKKLQGVHLNYNLLTEDENISYASTSKISMGGGIAYNRFTFNGIEYVAKKFRNYLYWPQANINIHTNGNILSVSAGGTLSNNTYKWYKEGTATPTVIQGDSAFQPSESGNYHAEISNSVATSLMLKTDTVAYTASFKKDESKLLSIYPNPVKNMLIINGLNKTGSNKITIADLNGNIRLTLNAKQLSSYSFNVSSLKPGNYILNVINENRITTINFIKE